MKEKITFKTAISGSKPKVVASNMLRSNDINIDPRVVI
jgi:hypothetical protein